MESVKSENIHIEVHPIIFKGVSGKEESPRCMLRIPDKLPNDLLKVPSKILPAIGKAYSAANSPLPLSPRTGRAKGFDFPDVPIRGQVRKDSQETKGEVEINANTIRNMKKHSSDKRINSDHFELPAIKSPINRKYSEKQPRNEGGFVFN